MTDDDPSDLINITVAASRLGVGLDKMRAMANADSIDGFVLRVWRDPETNVRYFSRAQIESLRARRARRFVESKAPLKS